MNFDKCQHISNRTRTIGEMCNKRGIAIKMKFSFFSAPGDNIKLIESSIH